MKTIMARWRYKYEHSGTLSQSMKAAWSEPEIIGPKGGYVTALGRSAVFVLTGGPGGGKTTFMGELRNEDPKLSEVGACARGRAVVVSSGFER